ncbi:MAG: hypothetical protein GX060_04075 [Firmicutes bacterium]|nr:hypothetical protein [Bacillota bacterium]
MRKILFALVIVAVSLLGCTSQGAEQEARIAGLEQELAAWEKLSQSQQPLLSALQVVQLLKEKDFAGLANWVHPEKGVRFSPYPHVYVEVEQVFTVQQIAKLWQDETVYHWGTYDGIGDPIKLTFADYYQRFIYDYDFAEPQMIGNNHLIGRGNAIDNVHEVYPQGKFIEFYFEGQHPEYGGADWRSLKLVFEQHNGSWYLVGVIHGEWTI